GLCNGTQYMHDCYSIGHRCIEGQRRLLPRIKLSTTEDKLPFTLTSKQFPLRVCFEMTALSYSLYSLFRFVTLLRLEGIRQQEMIQCVGKVFGIMQYKGKQDVHLSGPSPPPPPHASLFRKITKNQ
ncbi:hypothetical protein BDZ91DRAFT_649279, partial [Kalaharituber pfeilii]